MVYGFPEVHYKNWKSEHKLEGHWLPIYSMNIFAIVNIIKVIKMLMYIVHFIKKVQWSQRIEQDFLVTVLKTPSSQSWSIFPQSAATGIHGEYISKHFCDVW